MLQASATDPKMARWAMCTARMLSRGLGCRMVVVMDSPPHSGVVSACFKGYADPTDSVDKHARTIRRTVVGSTSDFASRN